MIFTLESKTSIALVPQSQSTLDNYLKTQPEFVSNWVRQTNFQAKPDSFCLIPGPQGGIQQVLVGIHEPSDQEESAPIWAIADLALKLPRNVYHIESDWDEDTLQQAAIGWGLGAYRFEFYKQAFIDKQLADEQHSHCLPATLKLDASIAHRFEEIHAFVDAFTLVRDLVNSPANQMMPEDLSAITQEVAAQFKADFSEIVGDDLLEQNYPAIHAVGRASVHAPRLLKLEWNTHSSCPLLCLVGKGVCFDTGGLDLKPSKFMRNMKKDMGGAAHVLGLAHLIMALKLPVRLQLLVPAVDNAISGDAYRPGDVLNTRNGKTVEIDNTDAEGRVVLCDALSFASEQSPDLIIDFATLTGAARVAVGTEIPALFSNKTTLAAKIQQAAMGSGEVVWPLPMHQPYRAQLDSSVADLLNSSDEGYAGAITAALYLNEFVPDTVDWAHLDVMAWNTRQRAGRPKGGEAMGLLAVYRFLAGRYL